MALTGLNTNMADKNFGTRIADTAVALTEKETPVDADLILIADSEDSNNPKKVKLGNLPGGGGGGGSGLLASTQYNPSGTGSFSTTDQTFADVSAANLSVTFTVPASGAVIVRLTAPSVSVTANEGVYFNLRSGSSDVASTNFNVAYAPSGVAINGTSISYAVKLTGLTPSAEVTYKWGWAVSSGGTATMYYGYGTGLTTNGALLMEVLSA